MEVLCRCRGVNQAADLLHGLPGNNLEIASVSTAPDLRMANINTRALEKS